MNNANLTARLLIAAGILGTTAIICLFLFPSLEKTHAAAGNKLDERSASYSEAVENLNTAETKLAEAKLDYSLQTLALEKKYYGTEKFDKEIYVLARSEAIRLSEKLGKESPRYILPLDLFYIFLRDDSVYITQTARQHFANNGLLAVDIGTHGKSLPIYAPDWQNKEVRWTVEKIDYPKSTGHSLILTNEKLGARWLIGHVHYLDEYQKVVMTGDPIGLSGGVGEHQGVSTGAHAHLEFFTRTADKWLAADYRFGETNRHEIWHKKETMDYDLDKLAKAVAIHETGDCTKGYGLTYNNCFGIKNGSIAPCEKTGDTRTCIYDSPEESYAAFKKIWAKSYKTFPDLEAAKVWSANNPKVWLEAVVAAYGSL